MELRKPAIAGVAAVAVISVGAFAQAMFSDEGFAGWSRGWDVVESFVRPSSERRNPEPLQKARVANWTSPHRPIVHRVGDATAGQARRPRVGLEALDNLPSTSEDPMAFGAWQGAVDPNGAGDDAGIDSDLKVNAGLGTAAGAQQARAGSRAERSNTGRMIDFNRFSVIGEPGTSFSPLAMSLMGGSFGGNGFSAPYNGFPQFSTVAGSEGVETPVPPGMLFFLTGAAAIVSQRKHIRSHRFFTL
ncbi:MAG: hypothetical protein AAFX52_07180 [Pseudomonadota bacterium]